MLIALKLLACIILASFGITIMAPNEDAENIGSSVFVFATIITAIVALTL